jgi:hypothetical protein
MLFQNVAKAIFLYKLIRQLKLTAMDELHGGKSALL